MPLRGGIAWIINWMRRWPTENKTRLAWEGEFGDQSRNQFSRYNSFKPGEPRQYCCPTPAARAGLQPGKLPAHAGLTKGGRGNRRRGESDRRVCLDGGKYGQLAFLTQGTKKSGHRYAAEKTLFPRRWYGRMVSANLEVIREMSVMK